MNKSLHRLSLDAVISQVAVTCLSAETAPTASASARVLAQEVRAVSPIPAADRAALDGFAVAAAATIGASSYNPLPLPLRTVSAGDAMPPGTDAVMPLELGQQQLSGIVECVEPVSPGENIEPEGSTAAAGALLAAAGTLLSPAYIGILVAAGFASVSVVRRPFVQIIVAPAAGVIDSNGPMCQALVNRDGGVAIDIVSVERSQQMIRSALEREGVDLVLLIGGTGPGTDDHAAAALIEVGDLPIHGIALRPGETAGCGRTSSGVPVILLPGSPAACFVCYEMLTGRVVRCLAGRDAALPYGSRTMRTEHKIVSAIGMTEICPVRCAAPGIVEPLPSFGETGLMSAITADGFVIVPEASEGYPAGASITVYLYEESMSGGRKR